MKVAAWRGALRTLVRYLFGFRGRASRAEWWAVNLTGFVPYIVAFLVLPKGYEPGVAVSIVFASSLFIMSYLWIACSVRRLHDRGKHGAWFFLYFLPVVGPMWMLIECGILGSVDSDRYGLSARMLREVFD
jgi:uncharacterized membrane protein YhaH (DUF805 family)